ncbi:hypothetical protein [Agrobacterium rosae]|uniref:hypothetical protein n=1 Tax=Agrobacterium rosae TaxID=1972867 RepID=UPI003A7F9685
MTFIIDFDQHDWMPVLKAELGELLSADVGSKLSKQSLQYKEDALESLERETSIEEVIDRTLNWIRNSRVRVFHGTRLTNDEVEKVKATGMRPLDVNARVEWLRQTFPELRSVLTDDFVQHALSKGSMEHRGNQLHAAISLKELRNAYDYLFLGSEFDRRIFEHAGRADLVPILTRRGMPRVIKMVVEGDEALQAMHPYFPIEFTRENDRYPNFVRDLLTDFAWMLATPLYQRSGVDSCLLFRQGIPGHQVEAIETVEERATV